MSGKYERSSLGSGRREQFTAAERITQFEMELFGDQPFDAIVGLFADGVKALERVRKASIERLNPEDALLAQRANRILNGAFRGVSVDMTAMQGRVRRSFTTACFILDSQGAAIPHQVGIAMEEKDAPVDADYTVFTLDGQGVSLEVEEGWRPAMTLAIPPQEATTMWDRYVAFKERQLGAVPVAMQTV
jgi:hypothetical protein